MVSTVRVAIVCEGATDYAVLRTVVAALLPQATLTLLQPDLEAPRRAGAPVAAGWQAVRAYLQSDASLAAASATDILVVHVDADVRALPNVRKALSTVDDEDVPLLGPLCEHVKDWFRGGVPANAIVVLPREAIEAWLVAAHTNLQAPEELAKPIAQLVRDGLVTPRADDDPNKASASYRELARPLASLVRDKKRIGRVPELARFVSKLDVQAHHLRKKASK